MRTSSRIFAVAATLTFLTGCYSVVPVPLPPPGEREATQVRGVVLEGDNGSEGEAIRFEEVFETQWRSEGLFLAGTLAGGGNEALSREFRYEELASVMARQLDVGSTSGLIGAAIVGTIAVIAFVITGQGGEGQTILNLSPG